MSAEPTPWEVVGRAVVNRRAAARLRMGHLWVYRSDILELEADSAGFVQLVRDGGNGQKRLGFAMCSPRSTITLRLVTHGSRPPNAAWLTKRLEAALARRRRALPDADAFRWAHGESDGLPGIFIDTYGDCVAVQSTCAAADRLEPWVVEEVQRIAAPRAIVLRDDTTSRAREDLPRHVTVAVGEAPVVASYHEGTMPAEVDLLADQKTGGFLDQVQNHVVAGRYARGRGLDCFTYHGGFALQMAARCDAVLACDISQAALLRAQENARLAGVSGVEWVEANAFDLLRRFDESGRRFDTIVLDPPAFASSKETVRRALGAYEEINRRALRLLAPGGVLITCSCSGRVRSADFDAMLLRAATDARRSVQLLERRGAGPDHPVLMGMPETEYLKCRVVAVV